MTPQELRATAIFELTGSGYYKDQNGVEELDSGEPLPSEQLITDGIEKIKIRDATAQVVPALDATYLKAILSNRSNYAGALFQETYDSIKGGIDGALDAETILNYSDVVSDSSLFDLSITDQIHVEYEKRINARYSEYDRWNITREAVRLMIRLNKRQRIKATTDDIDDALDQLLEADQWIDDMQAERDEKLAFPDIATINEWPAPPALPTPGES